VTPTLRSVGGSCAWLAILWLGACSDGTSPPAEPEPLHFTAITVATGATCGLTAAGAVYCWGSGDGGLFGGSLRPLQIASPVPLTTVSANSSSGAYACGLDLSGLPYCWGNIPVSAGGTHDLGSVPTALPGDVHLTSISVGVQHICGVAATHLAYCWGDFEGGRRGDPTISFDTSSATFQPNVVGGGLEFTEVAAGSVGTCGLTTAGQAYCWGSNYLGFLGNPAAPVQQQCGHGFSPCALSPVPVAGGHLFTSLSGSSQHACGLSGSDLYCWGLDSANQIGTAATAELCGGSPCAKQPDLVFAPGVTFASVSAGGSSTCALDSGHVPYCWGDNSSGQVGNGGGDAPVPALVAGRHQFNTIAITGDHACALVATGEAFCWGQNSLGQLGTGDQGGSNEPVAVVGPAAQ
jgi:alpha-tubulin suppressor-like RCC1 family protein